LRSTVILSLSKDHGICIQNQMQGFFSSLESSISNPAGCASGNEFFPPPGLGWMVVASFRTAHAVG
jgi:hypothetical protein